MAKQESKGTKTQIIIFASLRGLKHLAGFLLSLVSSPNGTKITVQSPALYKLRPSMNEDKIFHTGSMKKLVVETTIYEK